MRLFSKIRFSFHLKAPKLCILYSKGWGLAFDTTLTSCKNVYKRDIAPYAKQGFNVKLLLRKKKSRFNILGHSSLFTSCILTSRIYKPRISDFLKWKYFAFFSSFVWTMNQKFQMKLLGQLILKKHLVGFRRWQCQETLENPSNGTIIFAIFSRLVPLDSQRLLWGIMEDTHWGQ